MARVSSEAVTAFQEYKLKHVGSYLIFQLTGNGEVNVTKVKPTLTNLNNN